MARYLIRQAHGGESRLISDGALPYFQNQDPAWVVLDNYDDSTDDPPLYLSKAESDLRYAHLGDIGNPDSPTGAELRTFFTEAGIGGAVDSVNGQTGTVILDADDIGDGTTKVTMTTAERTKLTGVATAATANATDAQLRDRTTHTGTQAISTVTGLQTALDAKVTGTGITETRVMTAAAYAALGTKVATTQYLIVG